MAQFTAGASHAEPAASTTYATPLALGVFAFTTAILAAFLPDLSFLPLLLGLVSWLPSHSLVAWSNC